MGDGAAGEGGTGSVGGVHHLFLPTGAFPECWDFWTRVVGLPAHEQWGEGADRAGMVGVGPIPMVLAGGPGGFSEEFGTENVHGRPQVMFRAEDLDALFAAMKSRGAKVVREPFRTHWGPRAFTVQAPDGLVVAFVQ